MTCAKKRRRHRRPRICRPAPGTFPRRRTLRLHGMQLPDGTAAANQTSCTAQLPRRRRRTARSGIQRVPVVMTQRPRRRPGLLLQYLVCPRPRRQRHEPIASNAGAATTTTVATCTPVAASTGTINGTVWTGPSVTCNYAAAVLQTQWVASCTWGAPSGRRHRHLGLHGCGYTNGTPVTNQNSCTVVAQSTGTAAGTVWTSPAASLASGRCGNERDQLHHAQQSPTFAAPLGFSVLCCSRQLDGDQLFDGRSSSGTAAGTVWSGPAIGCAYSGTGATNLDAATCTANRQTASRLTPGQPWIATTQQRW